MPDAQTFLEALKQDKCSFECKVQRKRSGHFVDELNIGDVMQQFVDRSNPEWQYIFSLDVLRLHPNIAAMFEKPDIIKGMDVISETTEHKQHVVDRGLAIMWPNAFLNWHS